MIGLGFDMEVNAPETTAYVLDQERVVIVDLVSGKKRFVEIGKPGIGLGVSPDGKTALIQPRPHFSFREREKMYLSSPAVFDGSDLPLPGYYLVDMRTGKVKTVLKGKALGEPRWFPDSKRFIARTGTKRTDLGIVDIRRPNEIKVFLHDVNQWDVWFPPEKGG